MPSAFFCEFVDPGVLGRQEIKPVIQYLGGELSQTGQSLKRVLRGTFLVLGICDSEKKCSWEFLFRIILVCFMTVIELWYFLWIFTCFLSRYVLAKTQDFHLAVTALFQHHYGYFLKMFIVIEITVLKIQVLLHAKWALCSTSRTCWFKPKKFCS